MRRSVLLAVFVAALSAAAARTAEAQSYRTFAEEYDGLIRDARLRIGPLLFFPSILLRDLGFDDNIYYDAAGRLIRDYHATISPEVTVYLPVRRTLITWFRENPEYVFFLKQNHERSFKNSWGAGVRYLLFHRFILDAEYGREAHRRRVSRELPIPADDIGESWRAGFHYETARRTSFGISLFSQRLGYGNVTVGGTTTALGRILSRLERGAQAEIYYQVFVDGYAFLIGRRVEYAFDDPSQFYRNSEVKSLDFGLRFPLLGRVRGTLNLGYKRLDPRAEGLRPYSGFSGDTGLDFRVGRVEFRLNYRRDLVFSAYEGTGYYIEDGVGGGISFRLTRFFLLDYNYSTGRTAYPGQGGEAVAESRSEGERTDRHRHQGFGLTIRLSDALGINVGWSAYHWLSTAPGFDRRRNFFGVNLTTRI